MKKRAAFLIIILSLSFVLSSCSPAAGKDKSEAAANEGAAENTRAVEPGDILSREEAEALTGLKPDAIDKNDEESVGLKLIAYHFGDKLLQLSLNHMDSAFIQILYDGAKEIHDRHKGL